MHDLLKFSRTDHLFDLVCGKAQFSELVMESSPYGLSEAAASPEVQRLDPAAGVPPHLPDAPALSLGRCPCGLTAQSFR